MTRSFIPDELWRRHSEFVRYGVPYEVILQVSAEARQRRNEALGRFGKTVAAAVVRGLARLVAGLSPMNATYAARRTATAARCTARR